MRLGTIIALTLVGCVPVAVGTTVLPAVLPSAVFGNSEVVATIVGPSLVESVAANPFSGGWVISSVVDGRLYRVGRNGQVQPWRAASLRSSPFGLAVDRERGVLWSAWSPVAQSPAGSNEQGLLAIALRTGRMVQRIALPTPTARAGDMTRGPDGTLYVSDPINGAIFRLRPGAQQLDTLVAPGGLRSPQGIAVDQVRRRLYVADYSRGLRLVSLDDGAVTPLTAAADMELRGIDGLFLHNGALIAIQNGTATHRIVRLILDSAGTAIADRRVLEQANAAWDEPTTGTIVGSRLVYVGNSQWRRFGNGGVPHAGLRPEPTLLRAIELN